MNVGAPIAVPVNAAYGGQVPLTGVSGEPVQLAEGDTVTAEVTEIKPDGTLSLKMPNGQQFLAETLAGRTFVPGQRVALTVTEMRGGVPMAEITGEGASSAETFLKAMKAPQNELTLTLARESLLQQAPFTPKQFAALAKTAAAFENLPPEQAVFMAKHNIPVSRETVARYQAMTQPQARLGALLQKLLDILPAGRQAPPGAPQTAPQAGQTVWENRPPQTAGQQPQQAEGTRQAASAPPAPQAAPARPDAPPRYVQSTPAPAQGLDAPPRQIMTQPQPAQMPQPQPAQMPQPQAEPPVLPSAAGSNAPQPSSGRPVQIFMTASQAEPAPPPAQIPQANLSAQPQTPQDPQTPRPAAPPQPQPAAPSPPSGQPVQVFMTASQAEPAPPPAQTPQANLSTQPQSPQAPQTPRFAASPQPPPPADTAALQPAESPSVHELLDALFSKVSPARSRELPWDMDAPKLTREIGRLLTSVTETARDLPAQQRTELMNAAREIVQTLRFTEQINHCAAFAQLPITLNGERTTAQLYVFNDSAEKKKIDPQNATLFVSLHTANLGTVEGFVKVIGTGVEADFSLRTEEAASLFRAGLPELGGLLEARGYRLERVTAAVARDEEPLPPAAVEKGRAVRAGRYRFNRTV